ncbi:MAG: site-specific DNA-methyltransferase [Thermodesulfovibrionales bacterium]
MMDGESIDIRQNRLQRLKELFPELFVESQLDWEKLKAAFGDDINFANERYVLNWAGKSDAFKILQQPTTATLKPVPEESVNFDTTENLFIEGENLEVLKVLQKAYYGKVKCIDIDPPYNTGSDSFIYPDKFSEKKEDYLKRIGDKDEEGFLMKEGLFRKNSKDSGHYHSNWLSMMYPRLFLAKNLLRDDGVIFVHIDDNEVHNLRMVMNEIFGEENFVCQFIWKSRQNKDNRNITGASIDHEYILCYGRKIKGSQRKTEQYSNPDNDHRGPWTSGNMVGLATQENRPNLHYDLVNPETRVNYEKPKLGWRYDRETMNRLIQEKRIIWPESSTGRPRKKTFLSELHGEFTGFSSIIGKNIYTRTGTAEIESLFEFRIFDFPKPSSLLKELASQGADDGDIVLDFFGGSSPLAHAVLELNKEDGGHRKFILVQMPEPCDENSEAFKAGYKTIADIAKERIRRVIQKIKKEKTEKPDLFAEGKLDLGFKVFKLSSSNFKIWRGSEIDSEEKLVQQLDAFTNPIKPDAEKQNMLYELMLKAGYELTSFVQYVPLSKGKGAVGYYSINKNELIIALDAMNGKLIEQIISAKPQKVITLDSLFTGNDQLKTNTVLQMRDAGVDFKTI